MWASQSHGRASLNVSQEASAPGLPHCPPGPGGRGQSPGLHSLAGPGHAQCGIFGIFLSTILLGPQKGFKAKGPHARARPKQALTAESMQRAHLSPELCQALLSAATLNLGPQCLSPTVQCPLLIRPSQQLRARYQQGKERGGQGAEQLRMLSAAMETLSCSSQSLLEPHSSGLEGDAVRRSVCPCAAGSRRFGSGARPPAWRVTPSFQQPLVHQPQGGWLGAVLSELGCSGLSWISGVRHLTCCSDPMGQSVTWACPSICTRGTPSLLHRATGRINKGCP